MTVADAIRAASAREPDLGPSALAAVVAADLGRPVSRQLVAATLRRGTTRGRPRKAGAACPHCGTRLHDEPTK